jgi:hypothetical protein
MAKQSREFDNNRSKKLLRFVIAVGFIAIYFNIFIIILSGILIPLRMIENNFLRAVISSVSFLTAFSIFVVTGSFIRNKIVRGKNKYWYLVVIISGILGFIFYFNFTHQLTNTW